MNNSNGARPSRSRRALFIADAVFADIPGGSRVVARELARGLASRGHEVTFLVARQSGHAPEREVDADGVTVVRYPGAGSGLSFVRSGREACARLLRESSFDIVHTHFAYAAVGPLQIVPRSIPHVRTFHGPWDQEGWIEDIAGTAGPMRLAKARIKQAIRFRIEQANLRRSARIFALSDCFANLARSHYRLTDRNIVRVAGGVDFSRFSPIADKAGLRRKLGLPEAGPLLLSVRRLAPRMGLDRLIQAMPAIAEQVQGAQLVIGGRGPEHGRLEAAIRDLKLESRVRLLGFVPDDDLPRLYSAADLFVLPTLALEGFGLVTAEALACGTPVIGTPVGATPEILIPLDPRLVADDTTPAALAEAITSFLTGSWGVSLTAERVSEYVRKAYDWSSHVDVTEQAYADLLDRPRAQDRTESQAQAVAEAG